MRLLKDAFFALVIAVALITYHTVFPVVRLTVNDQRTVSMCAPPDEHMLPEAWHKGGI